MNMFNRPYRLIWFFFVSSAELLEIHSFVAKLPQSVSSTAQLMLKRLHADCMKYDAVDKAQADFTLGKAIRSLCE